MAVYKLRKRRDPPNEMPSQKPTRVRYGVLTFLSLACSSAYLTRHCMAVANTTIQHELNFTTEQMGWILSIFMFGYLWFQIPGGWLGTRLGARVALPSLSVLWSLLTACITLVSSYLPMLILRAAFGSAQAGLVPNAALVISHWIPLARRGISGALMVASMSMGSILTMGLTAVLLEQWDWRTVFLLYSLVGVIWAALFFTWFRNQPKEHPRVNQAEQDLILAPVSSEAGGSVADNSKSDALFTRLLRSRNMWAICGQQFFSAAGFGFFLTWFPAFLEKAYGVTRFRSGLMAMSPLLAAVIGYLAAGMIIDFLLARTGNKRISRSAVGGIGVLLCGLLLLASTWERLSRTTGGHGGHGRLPLFSLRPRLLGGGDRCCRSTYSRRHGHHEHGRGAWSVSEPCRSGISDRSHRTNRRRLESGRLPLRGHFLCQRTLLAGDRSAETSHGGLVNGQWSMVNGQWSPAVIRHPKLGTWNLELGTRSVSSGKHSNTVDLDHDARERRGNRGAGRMGSAEVALIDFVKLLKETGVGKIDIHLDDVV